MKNLEKFTTYFAPMEGITNALYRSTIMTRYPQWDYFVTPFVRVPTVGKLSTNCLVQHIGEQIFNNDNLRKKTILQFLCAENSNLEQNTSVIKELDFHWIDLNFGCPSSNVNKHHGGAYLLDHPEVITRIVRFFRKNYDKKISAKIRLGVNDTSNFFKTLKILRDEGVDLITIHARTKKQMYSGKADHSYTKTAYSFLRPNKNTTLVANGDIKNISDIKRINRETNCSHFMIGRGALSTPWIFSDASAYDIKTEVTKYLTSLYENGATIQLLKNISQYIMQDHAKTPDRLVLREGEFKNLLAALLEIL